ncbi:MAG: HlyD family efflux transporter periplasmic adaptor subunit [Anaerolineae bacterium]|jgi:HlyD family secretion protein|nr:HlyD family efflux transporter periplasmic adaptor subunit [Anaerolineae bacterium]MBT7072057.1 HlyD family efflux transporter periplasmic adaptor subunit [Anaerolineae bacterium]MBT7326681.1 HlyD family efflux transporter periplasmic adaptor subunit [Anaerolineae bacterium]
MKKTIHITLILTLALVGCSGTDEAAPLEASGVIEANEVVIAPELSGRILDITADEGDAVTAGDILFSVEGTLLEAERDAANATLGLARATQASAQAGLDAANAQYALILDAALAADRISRTTDWRIPAPGRFEQPAWYFSQSEELAAAQVEVDAAVAALSTAQEDFEGVAANLDNAKFLEMEIILAQSRATYNVAHDVYSRSQSSHDDMDEVINAAEDAYTAARDALHDRQDEYDEMLSTQAAKDVLKARAEVTVAQERYNMALDQLRALQTGAFSPSVVAAAANVQQAEAALGQAQKAIEQVEAQIQLLETQMEKLVTRAPIDGVVLTRSIEVGEVIQAGLAVMNIAPLDELTVTVYIPEDRYGQVNLGDSAILTVDSFPEESFEATVIRIADQAEYTPRNVQTKEERQTTVYAVKLSVCNKDGKLKPGMPTDLIFGE